MNKIKTIIVATTLSLSALTLTAQITTPTNAPPSGLADLGNTVLGYLTSINPALDPTFGANKFDLWVGVSSLQGGPVPLANDIGLSYDIWKGSAGTNSGAIPAISLENVIRDGGVAGTLISEQAGLGLSVIIHDVKLTAYCDGLYDLASSGKSFGNRLDGEVGIRAKKALGLHFYSGVGIGARLLNGGRVFSVFTGATF